MTILFESRTWRIRLREFVRGKRIWKARTENKEQRKFVSVLSTQQEKELYCLQIYVFCDLKCRFYRMRADVYT
jgi:hypothetical protein